MCCHLEWLLCRPENGAFRPPFDHREPWRSIWVTAGSVRGTTFHFELPEAVESLVVRVPARVDFKLRL